MHRKQPNLLFVLLTCSLGATAGFGGVAWGQTATSRMVSNAPFAAQAEGIVGAIGVDISTTRSPVDVESRVEDALRITQLQLKAAGIDRTRQMLQRLGRLRPGQPLPVSRLLVLTQNGQLVLPDLNNASRSRVEPGNGTLTFTYEGWSSSDQAKLQDYVNRAIPFITAVYGPPAFSITVNIKQDSTLTDLQGGVYSPSLNEIRLPPLTDNFPFDSFTLTHMIIHAYHDDLVFSFDAWEEGFARAAAAVAQRMIDPTLDMTYDPFYLLPLYENLNEPELGNNSFNTTHSTSMFPWRFGMAQAAWLKVYAENPNFFKQFNAAYYSQVAQSGPTLAGNVPALKQILLSVVPTVEGITSTAWYDQQWILNTAVNTGTKLYVYNLPTQQSVALILDYYSTDPTGDETHLAGTANLTYRNDTSNDLFAEEGNTADIVNGEGFISPQFFNVGGPNLIFVDIVVGNYTRTIAYPYGVRGADPNNENPFWGAILGATDGTLTITPAGGMAVNTTVSRGVFAVSQNLGMTDPKRFAISFTPTGGQAQTYARNTAFGFYVGMLTSIGSTTTLTHTYPKEGPRGFRLISVPMHPVQQDEALALGLDPTRALIGVFQPRLSGDYKYELYPNISGRFDAGRSYFIRQDSDLTVNLQGALVPDTDNFTIPLLPGFNMFGQPFNHVTNVSDLQVQVGNNTPIDFATAQANGLVGRGVWSYDPVNGFQLSTQLVPWEGYELRITHPDGIHLIIPPTKAAQQPVRSRAAGSRQRIEDYVAPGGWAFRIRARGAGTQDNDNFIGVAPGANDGPDRLDIQQPPELGGYVSLFFPQSDGRGTVTRLAADIRAPFAGSKEWDFVVQTDLGDQEVTLLWDDLSSLPREYRPVLRDLDGGVSRYMRTTRSYVFRTGSAGVRRFSVVVDSSPASRLSITGITPTRAPGGMSIAFTLSSPAQIDAVISNATGREVRHLSSGAVLTPGTNVLGWDMRDDAGRRVPPGIYVARLTATGDIGQAFQAIRTLVVTR